MVRGKWYQGGGIIVLRGDHPSWLMFSEKLIQQTTFLNAFYRHENPEIRKAGTGGLHQELSTSSRTPRNNRKFTYNEPTLICRCCLRHSVLDLN
eukprot:scaffold7160_cov156-Ochromonas_danica.AAC.4